MRSDNSPSKVAKQSSSLQHICSCSKSSRRAVCSVVVLYRKVVQWTKKLVFSLFSNSKGKGGTGFERNRRVPQETLLLCCTPRALCRYGWTLSLLIDLKAGTSPLGLLRKETATLLLTLERAQGCINTALTAFNPYGRLVEIQLSQLIRESPTLLARARE